MRWRWPSAAALKHWAWFLGFVARLVVAGLLFSTLLALIFRFRETTALVRYAATPSELVVPVQGVARETLRGSWGQPRPGNRRHEGIDIFARRGTPVVAAAPGAVTRVGHDRLGGNVVWVAGAGARLYYYAHLDEFAPGLRPGLDVPAGYTLGRVGTSGDARGTSPHLHFGIYPAGRAFRAVDPLPLLQGRAATESDSGS
jgi:murein DD-endopeptidase MepM/ murein hydrolase activator NlpD